jgi:hypothetical protein
MLSLISPMPIENSFSAPNPILLRAPVKTKGSSFPSRRRPVGRASGIRSRTLHRQEQTKAILTCALHAVVT